MSREAQGGDAGFVSMAMTIALHVPMRVAQPLQQAIANALADQLEQYDVEDLAVSVDSSQGLIEVEFLARSASIKDADQSARKLLRKSLRKAGRHNLPETREAIRDLLASENTWEIVGTDAAA